MHAQLFPFWRTCFHVVKASRILVLDSATGHRGQRYDRSRYASILITGRMHANSDTEACMHACLNPMMKSFIVRRKASLNNHSKLKGQYTDVKSACGTSVGPSLNPHSLG